MASDNMPRNSFFYHIASRREVEDYRSKGSIAPPSLAAEGFVHCSFLDQLLGVAGRFFAGRDDLEILRLSPRAGMPPIEVEPVVGEPDRYPHVFGALPWSVVDGVFSFEREADGAFVLPSELATALVVEARELAHLEGAFDWFEHAEGMRFVETHRNDARTSGHVLFVRGRFSSFHRVRSGDELWMIHEGALRLHVVDGGRLTTFVLGTDVARGERPVIAVPAAAWQAAELVPDAPYALASTVCAPPFDYDDFELADPETSRRLASGVVGLASRLGLPD